MTSPSKYDVPVFATPIKSFFVSMLTRDIQLEDAVLDLLDNCVDGILRSGKHEGANPYSGYWAEIKFSGDTFEISDNCGGIPWDLHDYAFTMGRSRDRPADAPGMVGAYGIGMKRAIFKIGRDCLILTRNGEDQYEIEIPPAWLDDESDWKLKVTAARRSLTEDGTTIIIGDLNEGIAEQFGEGAVKFKTELERMVSTHYAYIIEKGFEVRINGEQVEPRTTHIVFDSKSPEKTAAIRPFIFKSKVNNVNVFLAVGFTRSIPSQSEILDEQERPRYSSMDAGWTILCNDRAVLYCDRSELTGWGEAGVPRYHTQFIAISGIVAFSSEDASKLPTTTTKRGIDASSSLYLQIKNKMREGMRLFTDYTNKWKGRPDEAASHMRKGRPLSLRAIEKAAEQLQLTSTRSSFPPGEQYKPSLPQPPTLVATKRRISFVRDISKIKSVAGYLGDTDLEPSEVGEKCFDIVYEEASRKWD